MIGEIRDLETATIAINASLTGHLVFSTLHTNDAPSAVTRLIDIGVKPFLVASSTRALMAQRLVRKICKQCAAPYAPTEAELRSPRPRRRPMPRAPTFMKGKGCAELQQHRLPRPLRHLRDLRHRRRGAQADLREGALLRAARRGRREMGMRTLREDGVRKVLAGLTTPDEVIRATVGRRWH